MWVLPQLLGLQHCVLLSTELHWDHSPPDSAPQTRNGESSRFCHTSTREADKLDQGQVSLSLVAAGTIARMCIGHAGPTPPG